VCLQGTLAPFSRGWGRPKETHVVEDAEGREALSKITWEIVHVAKTQEQIDGDDNLVVDYSEVKNGNGSNGHDQR
jgi:hypothetical protein